MTGTHLSIPFEAYQGDDPYIFVSYAHLDAEVVYPELQMMKEHGYRIWFDEGIDPGNEWPEEIANAIAGCSCFIVYITPNSVESQNVRNEINFALNRKKAFLAIHLVQTQLPVGLDLRMGDIQAILKYRQTEDSHRRKIFKSLSADLRETPPAIKRNEPPKQTPLKIETVELEPVHRVLEESELAKAEPSRQEAEVLVQQRAEEKGAQTETPRQGPGENKTWFQKNWAWLGGGLLGLLTLVLIIFGVLYGVVAWLGSLVAEPTKGPAVSAGTSSGQVEEFFSVSSKGVAYNKPTAPTAFTITSPWSVTEIMTYHWNDGYGKLAGTISLQSSDGKLYGPWQAANREGSGRANVAWVVTPKVTLPPGTYIVIDSDPDSWAQNRETGGAGMAWGKGIRQANP